MDKESTSTTEYKGVQLEGLDKETSMAHSAFFESSTGIEHFETLLNRDKATLTPEQFTAISALNSVANMNYQICNGGLDQYYFNEYDKEREPYTKDDVKRLDKDSQVKMLRELQAFAAEVFPEREEDNARLERIISDFDNSSYEEPTDSWSYEEEEYYEEGGLNAPHDFDERFYEVNDYLETLIEAYAQYLDKSIDLDLSKGEREKTVGELAQEAKDRAGEKNTERADATKERRSPELGL